MCHCSREPSRVQNQQCGHDAATTSKNRSQLSTNTSPSPSTDTRTRTSSVPTGHQASPHINTPDTTRHQMLHQSHDTATTSVSHGIKQLRRLRCPNALTFLFLFFFCLILRNVSRAWLMRLQLGSPGNISEMSPSATTPPRRRPRHRAVVFNLKPRPGCELEVGLCGGGVEH